SQRIHRPARALLQRQAPTMHQQYLLRARIPPAQCRISPPRVKQLKVHPQRHPYDVVHAEMIKLGGCSSRRT
ncbi:MAG: hypothetical protein QOE61_2782, partial [Micromonosporaceae bacterium]|nr:hypothetical protein [Micromonosporaceae bacterium]